MSDSVSILTIDSKDLKDEEKALAIRLWMAKQMSSSNLQKIVKAGELRK